MEGPLVVPGEEAPALNITVRISLMLQVKNYILKFVYIYIFFYISPRLSVFSPVLLVICVSFLANYLCPLPTYLVEYSGFLTDL